MGSPFEDYSHTGAFARAMQIPGASVAAIRSHFVVLQVRLDIDLTGDRSPSCEASKQSEAGCSATCAASLCIAVTLAVTPRLPRRYSPSAPRSSSSVPPGPIIGTSGSTPLHFAAANGHTAVARLLLQHGARPARPDKHGVTPEMLARRCRWIDCADAIAEFVREKDRDLRERETLLGLPDEYKDLRDNKECVCMWKRDRHGSTCSCETGDTRRLLHVKRSIDNVVHALKPSTPSSHTHSVSLSSASLLSGSTRRGPSPEDGTHSPCTPDSMRSAHSPSPSAFPPRRPSLPTDELPRKPASSRKKEKERRPSSAGTGASASPASVRKLGSKYSLLNLFRRGSTEQERELTEDGAADDFVSDGRNASVENVRPGILRGHQRALSGPSTPNFQVLSTTNGSVGTGQGSGRALRFDNYNWDAWSRSRSPGRPDINDGTFVEDDEFDDDDDEDEDDEDEEEYGQPLPRATFGLGLRPVGSR
ncbi:hypothetical protein EVG20_g11647 [Dentipellis fragilis]|uniref:Uncharacterized protein n=1 Tax=Dentipellis fragilis TaxID=205917 RepID=A0A4Y9XM06_9AGAM|nr:hypothetical protein EVG20_g11647 [Dentipellis fragilis]